MKIHEYQAKTILRGYGVRTPQGDVATTPAKAVKIVNKLLAADGTYPFVIKSQVLVGGRGKAGGVKLANTIEEVASLTTQIRKLKIKGEKVKKVLVEQGV